MNSQKISEGSSAMPLDLEELTSRCLGRMDLVERVLGRFQESLGQDLQELEQAVMDADTEGVARVAHRMKGTSVTIAAHSLQGCAERLEESAKTNDCDELGEYLSEFRQECERLSELITNQ